MGGKPQRSDDRLTVVPDADGRVLTTRPDLEAILARVPTTPGCYLFKDGAGTTIYVGKAKQLRRRVGSYFRDRTVLANRTARMIAEAHDLEVIVLDSEVEALLLENRLIKDLQPAYNVLLKDGKEYPLLAITREVFPRVFITRDRELPDTDFVGPFISAAALKSAYHFLARSFQFRTCTLDIQDQDPRRRTFRPCLNYHIKRCSGPCAGKISAADYGQDIKALRAFLSGRGKRAILADLEARMSAAAADLRYEEAARYRDQIRAIDRLRERGRLRDYADAPGPVYDPQTGIDRLAKLLGRDTAPRVVEGFDIAHLQGTHVVAAMVQFVDGVPNKAAYRRYRIRGDTQGTVASNDDFAAMAQVVGRRYRRLLDERRTLPDLILIDGGLGQVHAAVAACAAAGWPDAPIIGLAKQDEILITPTGQEIHASKRDQGLKLLMHVRDEAHRFSRRYYHLLQRKGMLA